MRSRSTLFVRLFAIFLVGALLMPIVVSAQDASPVAMPGASPVATGETIVSKTCAEVKAEWMEAYAGTDEPPANTEGAYIVGDVADLQSVNPFLAESDPSLTVVQYVFEALFSGDPRTGEPSPCALTDYWEISPDGLTYTFHLNTAAKWHDGVDFTSADVIFSLDALADPATASAYTGTFLNTVASWQAIDDDTVQIVAYEPRFTVLYDLQGLFIVPKHIWESIPHDQWATDPGATGQDPSRVIGTGAFRFESWSQGQEIRLTRNDDYYDLKPSIKEFVFRIFPDGESQFNAFLNGEIDSIGLEPEQVQVVEGTDGVSWSSYPNRGFTYYEFNLNAETTTLFQDERVRQAFMWALDRDSIVANILLGFGEVASGTQPSISYAYAPEEITTNYTYDPERAKALLAEAGWTDTDGDGVVDKDGQKMSFEFLYPAGLAVNDTLVAYMQDAWRAVGIEMTPQALEFSALIEATTTNPTFEMALYGFGWDASFLQDAMFGCDQYQVGFNDMMYCNPELDTIFTAAKAEFDFEKRRALLVEAANVVNDEQPIGVIFFSVGLVAWNDRVHNYVDSAWGNQSYIGVWVDE